jgi:probable rRNA maturation factor
MTAMSSAQLTSHDVAVLWEADSDDGDPDKSRLIEWAHQVLDHQQATACELAIKILNADESRELNSNYRGMDKPTNVLSFPLDSFSQAADSQPGSSSLSQAPVLLLGDLALCASVIRAEAQEQNKSVESHYAHMVVHGVLHLLGFDHQVDEEAEEMEQLEREVLEKLGFEDPYKES